jgi:N-methylhydantoinase A
LSRYRIGVDIGGTFTDFAVHDTRTGRLAGLKVPTVPADPVRGVLDGLDVLATEHGVAPGDIDYFVHGTTIAVNTLIERKGARLGLLVTQGFRDLLIIQRLRIPNPQDWFGGRPEPLVPRRNVYEIDERLHADGSVARGLDEASVLAALGAAREAGLAGLVVCFLHSFRNPDHERRVKEILAGAAPELFVCCSHEVWPRMREYERAIVSLINAYVMPRVEGYLGKLEDSLAARGVPAAPYITRSNGGLMSARSARLAPADTLLSGPAAGVMGAVLAASEAGISDFITLDVGGTSADVAIVEGGRPQTSQHEHVADFPVMMPVVGVSSIGAGGGSIARVDESGVLRVGPESAGSDPGPACYGRGNREATVTDAFLAGGYLDAAGFAGGRLRLSLALAEEALAPVAAGLGLELPAACEAVLSVAVAASYAELSNLAAKRGVGLRDYSLVPFGGAGPLLATRVADEAGIRRILIPPAPGTLCALGALAADVAGDFVRSVLAPLDECMETLPRIYAELEADARAWLEREAPALERFDLRLASDMRYVGQSFEIDVDLDPAWLTAGDRSAVEAAFHAAHHRVFAHADSAAAVEMIDLRVLIAGTTPKPVLPAPGTGASGAPPRSTGSRPVMADDGPQQVPVHRREGLRAGQRIRGPALVDQADTTVWIGRGWTAEVHPSGGLLLERSEA